MNQPLTSLPYVLGKPGITGIIKTTPEDFRVEEILSFEASGAGEHVMLRIEKRGENTDYVARQLARFVQTSVREIGYAGLKDRHGCTVQWFSVRVPLKTELDWHPLESATIRILEMRRNTRKLQKGAISGNRFEIVVRQLSGDHADLERRLIHIRERGVPNYFGAQRFGHQGNNLDQALALFAGTLERIDSHRRGIYLSAARSYLFNLVLAERVKENIWDQAINGDAFMFSGSRSFFKPESITSEILRRVDEREIHPSGPLWGLGDHPTTDQAELLEDAIAGENVELCQGLERFGLEMARRPLRVCPTKMEWDFIEPDHLSLRFNLPAGAYATTLLRELVTTDFSDE
jgi:tRNA pseudouridine13 synthase